MTEYQIYLEERDKMDYLHQMGFRIKSVNENLSGAFVEFERKGPQAEGEVQTLHIQTAEGRKYFSVMLIQQQGATTA